MLDPASTLGFNRIDAVLHSATRPRSPIRAVSGSSPSVGAGAAGAAPQAAAVYFAVALATIPLAAVVATPAPPQASVLAVLAGAALTVGARAAQAAVTAVGHRRWLLEGASCSSRRRR